MALCSCVKHVPNQHIAMIVQRRQPSLFQPITLYSNNCIVVCPRAVVYIGDMANFAQLGGLVDDKINPWDKKNFGEESIRQQVDTCLKNLKTDSVEILYLHAPDHNTPLDTTLSTMNQLHKEGKFKQLGLSNYSSWLVSEVVNICKVRLSFTIPKKPSITIAK